MLIHPRPRAVAGRIVFDFERLPVAVGACCGTLTGTAYIGYDGHGAWWLDQLAISNPRAPGPSSWEPVSSDLYAQVRERLDRHRRDDIAEMIEAQLARGAHQRLFDEHRPHADDRRGAPPHARRSALALVTSMVGTAAELVCLAALLAGVGTGCLALDVRQAGHPHAHVVRLDAQGDRR